MFTDLEKIRGELISWNLSGDDKDLEITITIRHGEHSTHFRILLTLVLETEC